MIRLGGRTRHPLQQFMIDSCDPLQRQHQSAVCGQGVCISQVCTALMWHRCTAIDQAPKARLLCTDRLPITLLPHLLAQYGHHPSLELVLEWVEGRHTSKMLRQLRLERVEVATGHGDML